MCTPLHTVYIDSVENFKPNVTSWAELLRNTRTRAHAYFTVAHCFIQYFIFGLDSDRFSVFHFMEQMWRCLKRYDDELFEQPLCSFPIMHIVSKFQFFIHVFAMVKLKKKNHKLERGGENGCFCNFFKVQYLRELLSYKLNINFKMLLIILAITFVKNIVIILICDVSKHK